MQSGTVKSFNHKSGYGFITPDEGGDDIFVHRSAVRKAGLAALKKGQRVSFNIYDNGLKKIARDLQLGGIMSSDTEKLTKATNVSASSILRWGRKVSATRQKINRADLEAAVTRTMTTVDKAFVGVIVERIIPGTRGGANWRPRGIKYGRADREKCEKALSAIIEQLQQEFELIDK